MAGCMRSCGKCPAKCYSKAASSDSVSAGGAEFVSFVSVSSSTGLPKKAKTAPSPSSSPSFELGPVSAPFGSLSEVAAGPQGAPEVSTFSPFPAAPVSPMSSMAAAAPSPSSSLAAEEAAAEAIFDDEVSAAIERMVASTEGTSAAESAFEA